ncbi:MAG: calcium/sodium antiporter [Gemmatimonadota bacterium]|nr:calcium/sodium antiporter [Gemmatimonadota bacterium]MDH4351983.1 calcium/sodium antiporter [Gemmatimonadota bacterium]
MVVVGIAALAAGGELLVRGAVSLARALRVSTAVIGLTVVAAGTSMPELAVSLFASLQGKADIAVGNVVGSNIFNVAAILGIAALLAPMVVHLTAVRLEWPVMAIVSVGFLLLARDGIIDRLEGGVLLVVLIGFTTYMIRLARRHTTPEDAAAFATSVDGWTGQGRRLAVDLGLVAGGVILLVGGAQVLVRGAATLATAAGLSERVVGLTIVAAGTSMPELAASLVAARRKQAGIALANVIGSNIFNLAGILGLVSVVTPQRVNSAIIHSDNWWMVGFAIVLFPIIRSGMRIGRGEGAVLLAAYGVYLALLLR